MACHAVRGNGSHLGPDLSDIGAARRPGELLRSVQDPAAEVLPQNRSARAVPRSGTAITGRLLNQDAFSVQLIDAKEQVHSFWRADLRNSRFRWIHYAFVQRQTERGRNFRRVSPPIAGIL